MDFAEYPGLNGELAADFHARHFVRRDTHVYDPSHVAHMTPYNSAALAGLAVDVKPRLTKEQHDVLENEFQKQSKPNTNTKKRFAEILGVSLDKVNNWFQNRRAKSKQDAKKQAGAFNLLQATQQQNPYPGMNNMNQLSSDNVSPTYCPPDAFGEMRDSAILDGPMSNGLGISQTENQTHMMNQDFDMANHLSMENLGGMPMQPQRSQQQHQHMMNQNGEDNDHNRRTLTQAQFDAFGNSNAFMATSNDQSHSSVSATITNPSEIYGEYDFPDLCDFSFDNPQSNAVTSTPMRLSHSTDSYDSQIAPSHTENQGRSASATSDGSTPSVSVTPANQEVDPLEYPLPNNHSSQTLPSQPTSAAPWQPGQSIPVDLAALQQEFNEAAMRNRTQSVPSIPNMHRHYLEQPLAYPIDEAYPRRESSTVQLAHSMSKFSMTGPGQRSAMPSSTIAARRQRPRPAPLGGASLRSTSYCGQLPTSPGTAAGNHHVPATGQSLRRIKSSQTMNGIANGRIQKNFGASQRSPSGVAFADVANAGRYARRVSSFSPAFAGIQAASAGLAPPTPMSPSSYANLQTSGTAMRQASISESDSDNMTHVVPSNNFSPPSTPIYTAVYPRGRLGSAAINENTPPQSAPATQQCFPTTGYMQPMSQVQSSMPSAVPVLQSQHHGFVPMMSNEYPQMPNVAFPPRSDSLAAPYMDMPMSYIMTNTGEVHMGYALVPPPFPPPQMHHQATPPHPQHPFVPSSNSSPGAMVSSQVPKQSNAAADFFVHEYTPPQDVKQTSTTPRKAPETAPKNYTFSNHGPEFFERHVKKDASSPTSSAGGSSTA